MHWTDHKTVGLQYALTALGFLLVGFLLMLLMRWQLAWPTSPLPAIIAGAVGEANAPGGYILPEFWGSLLTMNMIFLPMFAMGLMGINRRLYDGGLQYTHAQPALVWNVPMTWAAFALGLFQLPFLINLAISLRRGAPAGDNPWEATTLEWQPAAKEDPRYTYEPRPDSATPNVRLGIWLFLASEAMLFGSLFSAYVLLRSGSSTWPPTGQLLVLSDALVLTAFLVAATLSAPRSLIGSTLAAAAFLVLKVVGYQKMLEIGLLPSRDLMLACWFTLTGMHALHVAGGAIASLWVASGAGVSPERDRERLHALQLYWYFVDTVWVAILIGFYVVSSRSAR